MFFGDSFSTTYYDVACLSDQTRPDLLSRYVIIRFSPGERVECAGKSSWILRRVATGAEHKCPFISRLSSAPEGLQHSLRYCKLDFNLTYLPTYAGASILSGYAFCGLVRGKRRSTYLSPQCRRLGSLWVVLCFKAAHIIFLGLQCKHPYISNIIMV